MGAALVYLGVSFGILLLLTVLYTVEDKKGGRVLLGGARASLDAFFLTILLGLTRLTKVFTHGFMRILLHYSLHRLLSRILDTLQLLEKKVENLVRHNRRVAKTIKQGSKEKTHLQAIAEHKEEVSLSEAEKKEMKTH
jgi:hypothetical protein